jgi:serine/threonine protein kinase
VSSFHCVISNLDGVKPYVLDAASSNHTYVNHHDAHIAHGQRHFLISGDAISLIGPTGKGVMGPPPSFRAGFEFTFVSTNPLLVPSPAAQALTARLATSSASKVTEKYGFIKELGQGNFATVYRAVCRANGEHVAVKVIEKTRFLHITDERWKEQQKEAMTLQKLNHPGIVSFREVMSTPGRLFVVTELLTGGELFERLVQHGPYPEARARVLMRRICEAVDYLHDKGIVHRDLKPENILLQSSENDTAIKLVDFGVATEEQGGRRTFCGSMSYVAPEVLRRRESFLHEGTYGKGVDMWSVGVICHVVLSKRPPFDEQEDDKMHVHIRDVLKFEGEEWNAVSSLGKSFVAGCLEMVESQRLTAKTALMHPWLCGVGLTD